MRWLNVPNTLTASRVVLTPVFLWLFFSFDWLMQLLGIAVFAIASLTDIYDGRFARKRRDVTDLGRFLDPLADKILVSSALIALVIRSLVSLWMVLVILIRDLLVTGLRVYAIHYGRPIVTSRLAKWKTILQFVAIFAILVARCLKTALVRYRSSSVPPGGEWIGSIPNALIALTMLVTVISGVLYVFRNRHLYRRGFQAV